MRAGICELIFYHDTADSTKLPLLVVGLELVECGEMVSIILDPALRGRGGSCQSQRNGLRIGNAEHSSNEWVGTKPVRAESTDWLLPLKC